MCTIGQFFIEVHRSVLGVSYSLTVENSGCAGCAGRAQEAPMNRTFDIFEHFPDGNALWRGSVDGHEEGIKKLKSLASATENEVRLIYLPDKTLVAAANVPRP